MQPALLTARCLTLIPLQFHSLSRNHSNPHLKSFSSSSSSSPIICFTSIKKPKSGRLLTLCSSAGPKSSDANCESVAKNQTEEEALTANLESRQENGWRVEVGNPNVPPLVSTAKLSLSDQAFFLLAFIACTTSAAFVSLVIAAVPTLYAMGKAAISLSKLADTAREELPSTMAAIRLSGMEISDLTLELSDLSQEIADGVSKSAQAVQAAEAGIRKVGSFARQQTVGSYIRISTPLPMIQERANLPPISLQPVVAGAAKKTSRAVGQATKNFINMISGGEVSSENQNENIIDRIEN
ncbi:hypothetical protein RHGRI_005265 [Rhododendron griersonianum]|uniref:Uncharacterized protein n=1 Tax=Rhododendron griersonianum TaxID=479676 RepID=A0AAV6LCN5_9ERIC|nr:hypothetical protein RHGRI_005265 [Rhododendron griersonianum]